MRQVVKMTVLVLAALALAGLCAGCQASKAKQQSAAPAVKKADPERDLAGKIFILKDSRDMRLALVRVGQQGLDKDHLLALARSITLGDLRSYVGANSQASRLVPLGAGRFRLEALRLVMEDALIGEAVFTLAARSFEVGGKQVESVGLERMMVDGKDLTAAGGLALYIQLLEAKMAH